MATIVLTGAFDFAHPPAWTTFYAAGGTSQLTLSDAEKTQTFYGTLTYTGTTSSPQVHGTVDRIYMTVGPFAVYDITGLSLDAARLQQLVLTPNGGAQFYAYVLAGNDLFYGTGGGTVLGLTGDDTIGSGSMSGLFDGGAGIDTFQAMYGAVSADLGTGQVIRQGDSSGSVLRLRSVENLLGSTGDDTLAGSAGDNLINGGAGIDTVRYVHATTAVQINLAAGTGRGEGNDTLGNIENAIGGSAADLLVGSDDANRLDGAAGNDTMRGGLGDDTYLLRQAGDVIVEAPDGGRDTVLTSLAVTLGAHLENLQLGGSAALDGTGNGLANRIVGNAAANHLRGGSGNDTLEGAAGSDTLEGGLGADRLDGGAGDDRYLVGDALDVIVADAGGIDTVIASVDYTLGAAAIETLTLSGTALNATGNAYTNRLVGTAAANLLDGGLGADTLQGGAGDDRYVVDQAGDRVVELAGGGIDQVRTGVSHGLAANVENLQLTGNLAIAGTGNTLANQITGNAAANLLDGGAGADTLSGGRGDDAYLVDSRFDVLVEASGGGTDRVTSSVSWTLAAQFEDLLLSGSAALWGTGNAAANHLEGNAGDNRLDGGAGADTLSGGLGDDVYLVDSAADQVVEAWNAGTDVVYSAIGGVLADNVEQFRLTGTASVDATGNTRDNLLVGNSGANLLDGGEGFDLLYGGAGDDTYLIDFGRDQVVEAANAGTDTIRTLVAMTLPDHVENGVLRAGAIGRELIGNTLDNTLSGNADSNLLDGGAGADTLKGGEGQDGYMIDNAGDVVFDSGSSLGDSVLSSVSIAALWNGIETVTLLGTENLNATGNAAANTMRGNAGANRLDGRAGADTLVGGAGDDVYLVDDIGDYLQEDWDGGTDRVLSSASVDGGWGWIETITLTGSADLDVTCRVSNVTIAGNAGDNRLDGIGGQNTVSYANATAAVRVDLEAGSASGFGSDQLSHFRGVRGSAFDDTLRGSFDANRLAGGAGHDRFELWNATADELLDFVSGSDRIAIDQSGLALGNGDLVIDGATVAGAPVGFAPVAELVSGFMAEGPAANLASAAAAIGSASADYAAGQATLFAVRVDEGVALYRFVSAGEDAVVEAAELSLLAVLNGATGVSSADFAWIA